MAAAIALAAAAPAAAEDWQLKATLPLEGATIAGVNGAGVVVLAKGSTAFRWTQGGGFQQIATASGCSIEIAGISDEGVILGTKICPSKDFSQYEYTLLAWTSQSGNTPIEPLAGSLHADAIAANGRFIATDTHGTGFNPTDDTAIAGQANVAPQTGSLLIGSSGAGNGQGIDIAKDGTTLTVEVPANYSQPPTFRRGGSISGPFFVRTTETFEAVFGLLPDRRVLARVAGPSQTEDPATDFPTMRLKAYDGSSPAEAPLSAGGMTATTEQVFLPGGGNNAIYGVASGGGVPAGDSAIVAWSGSGLGLRALPMFYEANPGGKAKVTPVAASENGAYLALSNGDLWYDADWEKSLPAEKLSVPEQVKKYAFEQQQYYEAQIDYWQQKQKFSVATLGPFAYINPVILASLAVGVVGQGTEFTVAVQNRDYWATVSLDPPDARWKTVASAPKVRIGKLKRPPGTSKASFKRISGYLAARLTLLANQLCAEDAINRGATAVDRGAADKARAQYAAGARCSTRAAAAAKRSKRLAPKAAPLLDRVFQQGLRSLGGPRVKLTKARWRQTVRWQVGQLKRLIALPPATVKDLERRLAKPGGKGKPGGTAGRAKKAAAHDAATAKTIGAVGSAFREVAGI